MRCVNERERKIKGEREREFVCVYEIERKKERKKERTKYTQYMRKNI